MFDVVPILQQHQLRRTDCREQVLRYLIRTNAAISHSDLEQHFDTFDRVTLYRTLETFENKGIIHKVVDDSGAAKFAFCEDNCHAPRKHADSHVHFQCTQCGKTVCLHKITIPFVKLPEGFYAEESQYLIKGTCDKCETLA